MVVQRFKSFTVAVFSLFFILFSLPVIAQHDEGDTTHQPTEQKGEEHVETKKGFNAAKVIFGHVLNGHEFHFMDINGKPKVREKSATIKNDSRSRLVFITIKVCRN